MECSRQLPRTRPRPPLCQASSSRVCSMYPREIARTRPSPANILDSRNYGSERIPSHLPPFEAEH